MEKIIKIDMHKRVGKTSITNLLKKKEEQKFTECKCGAKVNGRSKAHAESLMHAHLHSRIHKERMDAITKQRRKK